MANKKITDLTALTGTNLATGDVVEVVDVSATGSKKITSQEFFKGLDVGTALLPSLAFAGDQDTGLFHDTANELGVTVAGAEAGRFAANKLTILSAVADAVAGPDLVIRRNSASPAAADFIGRLMFDGEDSAGNQDTFASLEAQIDDATSTSEDGSLLIKTMVAGTLTTKMDISDTEILINLTTEDMAVKDAGSTSATQQDWVEVTVGGVTGYLHVFAAK